MDKRATSPSLFQLETMELKRMMKEVAGGGIVEASPISKPQNSSTVTITVSSSPKIEGEKNINYQHRGQWLRAAVHGANEGVVAAASLMMGVGEEKTDKKTMIVPALAAVVAGALSMAIGEFVSVQTQHDVDVAGLKKEMKSKNSLNGFEHSIYITLPNPIEAACASALAFSVGALVPLISVVFISHYIVRVGVLAGILSLALIMFGAIGAYLGSSSIVKGIVRMLAGGWIATFIIYGFRRLFHSTEGFVERVFNHGLTMAVQPQQEQGNDLVMFFWS